MVVCILASLGIWRLDLRADTGLPVGGQDFIAYWSAYDVVGNGGNPYDAETLRLSQVEQHARYDTTAQRYWNPPWALLVLAPVVSLPFALASSVWLVLSIMAAIAAVTFSWWLFVSEDRTPLRPLVLGVSLLFVPLLECIRLGQMGAAVAAVVLGGLVALRSRRDVLAGVLFGLTTVKPQAAFIVLFVVGIHALATRRWAVITAGTATVALLVASSRLLLPSAWNGWNVGQVSPIHWHSSTIAGWLRWLLATGGQVPTWPLFVVPLVGLLAITPWALRHRHSIAWPAIPALLAMSLLTAPYSWLADAVVLLPVQVVIVGAIARRRANAPGVAFGLLAVQALSLVVRNLPGTGLQHQIVVPVGLLCVYALARRLGLVERVEQPPATPLPVLQP